MEQYRTVFPPLLISMQQHLALVRELVRSVATGRVDGPLDSGYWDWVRTDAGGLARALRNPGLQRTWDDLGRVHGECWRSAVWIRCSITQGGSWNSSSAARSWS